MRKNEPVPTDEHRKAFAAIAKAGFPFIKIELEAQLNRGRYADWGSEDKCRTFLKKNISKDARDALVFDKFYRDGSVDSEWTLTIATDKSELLTEYVIAFKALSEAIGGGMDVQGAGMHITILQESKYPTRKQMDPIKRDNFYREVPKLLPSLLFLASHNYRSRGLGFRRPAVSYSSKYSAIYTHSHTCMEFRVFETCYDKPEAIFDKVEVIANCLKYYSKRKIKVEIDNDITFSDKRNSVERFFDSPEKLKALNDSLAYLKPKGKTIEQIKKERNFKLNQVLLERRVRLDKAKYLDQYQDMLDRYEKKKQLELKRFSVYVAETPDSQYKGFSDERIVKILQDMGHIPPEPGTLENFVKSRATKGEFKLALTAS